MKPSPKLVVRKAERGATLVVGLIMLVVITVLVTSAFTLSTTNLKSVGNMQFRDEAIAAANEALETVLSSPFAESPVAQDINVDLNGDEVTDYVVNVAAPACISDSEMVVTGAPPSSVSLGSGFAISGSTFHETVWDLTATVTDAAVSGASVQIQQGVRVLLTTAQFNAACS